MDVQLDRVLYKTFRYIDVNKNVYLQNLRDVVAIPSVSSDARHKADLIKMAQWIKTSLSKLGAIIDVMENIGEAVNNSAKTRKPPIILATIGVDRNKETLLVYCHYDVKPASVEDGWTENPFALSEKDGKLYGRGTSDNKGPLLCWLQAIEAYLQTNKSLPVNVKLIFEGMQEMGSIGLEKAIKARRNTFFKNIQYCCICDSQWLGVDQPCISYGLRGLCYFTVEVKASEKEHLSSSYFGGNIHEPMSDLVYLLNSLTDVQGNITIPCLNEDIEPVTPQEEKAYKTIHFDVEETRNVVGVPKLKYEDDMTQHLMRRWRVPSLSVHGIEGMWDKSDVPLTIPLRVVGRFSIRLVPNQKPERIRDLVTRYLENTMALRKSPNKLTVKLIAQAPGWSTSPTKSHHYEAAKKASFVAYRKEPCFTREGGTIPIVYELHRVTGASILLFPIGALDDNAHGTDEKIDMRNYIEGHKMIAAYIHLLGSVH